MSQWTLLSNHGHVLLFLSGNPEARLRDVAAAVGITERAVQKIVRDLQDGGMLSVTKHGRRNRYRIHTRKSLRHPLESHHTVGRLVSLVGMEKKPRRRKRVSRPAPVTPRPTSSSEELPRARPGVPPAPAQAGPPPVEEKPAGKKKPPEPGEPTPTKRPAVKKPPPDDQQGSLF